VYQQRGKGIDIAPFPGRDIAIHQLAQAAIAERLQGLLLRAVGDAGRHGRAGPLQRAVDRGHRCRKQTGSLLRAEAQHLAQYQGGALLGAQVLQRGDEGQFDAFVLFVTGFRGRAPGRKSDGLIGVGLEPDRFDDRSTGWCVRFSRWPEVVRQDALGPACNLGQTNIGRDPIQPRPSGAPVPQAGGTAPGAQHRFLQGVVGIVHRAEHPVTVRV
jgi:hypothetical protein